MITQVEQNLWLDISEGFPPLLKAHQTNTHTYLFRRKTYVVLLATNQSRVLAYICYLQAWIIEIPAYSLYI
jgi:hypothetical protein